MSIRSPASQTHNTRRSHRRRVLLVVVVIVAVAAWLVYRTIQSSTTEYVTVQDVKSMGVTQRLVRISGFVAPQSVDWQPEELVLRFLIRDDTGDLEVTYRGVRPDMFQDDAQLVAEGRTGPDGRFQASSLLLKCPSKYEEKE